MYTLFWRSPGLPYIQKQTPISVPPASLVSNRASVRFTGKGAANYAKVQQENLMRVLENFAGPLEPEYPTVGMTWFDTNGTTTGVLKVCVRTQTDTDPGATPAVWRALNSIQVGDVGDGPPTPANLGDMWFSRSGPLSGVLYTYTGVGRYPQADWDAFGYYPAPSADTSIILNSATFGGGVGSAPNEAYIHGFTSSVPADVAGSIVVNGVATNIGPGALFTRMPGSSFIVWDRVGATLTSAAGPSQFFAVRRLDNGQWQFDNDTGWVNFTPNSDTLAIGIINVAEADDNTPPGISSALMWEEAVVLDTLLQVPDLLERGAIGGWAQVWPTIEMAAGRKEYDHLLGMLLELIGDETGFGGSGAVGRLINFLTPFNTLDASLRVKYLEDGPDSSVALSAEDVSYLQVDPDSQDWDKLLAAARWAIKRYELPTSMLGDISPVPFITDGLPADPITRGLPGEPYRAEVERRTMVRTGSISMMRYYQETVNVLAAARQKRYALKGILGSSGTNTSFNPEVVSSAQAVFTLNAATFALTSPIVNGLKFRFDQSGNELTRFFTSGQGIELILSYTPGGTPSTSDTELQSACNSRGRIRVTQDAVYVLSTSPTPTLAQAPSAQGFSSVTAVSPLTLATITVGSSTIVLSAQTVLNAPHEVNFNAQFQTAGATTGVLSVTWRWINDTTTYVDASSVTRRLYPAPLAYSASTDKLGSPSFA